MNGIDYWDQRWRNASSVGEGSWEGDHAARALELEFIARSWPGETRSVFELGCGAMALLELPKINSLLLGVGYKGVDGSAEALKIARVRYPAGFFVQQDLEDPRFNLEDYAEADLLICRRLLQNLSKKARGRLIAQMGLFKAGIVLEGTMDGLYRINELRKLVGHPYLVVPEFNDYLSAEEVNRLLEVTRARESYPLSTYYAITRGILNTRDSASAFDLALRDPQIGGFGTHAAFVWGRS